MPLKIIKNTFYAIYKLLWGFRTRIRQPLCRICCKPTKFRTAYGRIFLECNNCGFIFTGDYPEFISNFGMGMVGSWGGPESGGEREDFLVRMLNNDLDKQTFLLYGVGSTLSFPVLKSEGFDVYGCDLSNSVVQYRQMESGKESFFYPRVLKQKKSIFDVIIACEVFEHFYNPKKYIELILNSLKPNGILCGCTNFYPGHGDIEDGQKGGYMSFLGHVAYWSKSSMSELIDPYGMKLVVFEMVCPGSVKREPVYNDLCPNKRVFFITADKESLDYLSSLKKQTPVLPIDISDYPIKAYRKNAISE